MEIIRIEKQNLVDEVYRQMYDFITKGSWKEGEKLSSENQLSKQFNVSRVVIREALQKLRTQKLIITKQGMGSYVSNPNNFSDYYKDCTNKQIQLTQEQFQNVMELRRCIEFRCIELSVTKATQQDYQRIFHALEAMKASIDDMTAYSKADLEFHYAVVKCAHNELFERILDNCKDLLAYCLTEMNKLNDSQNWGIKMHTEIAQKIYNKDAKGAIACFKRSGEYNFIRLYDFFCENEQK